MAIHPNEVATSMDNHNDTVVQATRVQGVIDSIFVSHYSMLRNQPIVEGGICRFRFYFTGIIQEGLAVKLDEAYKKNNWLGVEVRGWLLKDFAKLSDMKSAKIGDIGGHPAHVFEIELKCLAMHMR